MPAEAKQAPFPDPRKVRPMLATLVDRAFDAPGWLWEPKLDGIRTLAFIKDGNVELRSRRGVDVSKAYPSLVEALKTQPAQTLVLDGEVCALDEDGVPRFQLLQPRINLTRADDVARVEAEIPIVYFVFDLLYLNGHDLQPLPLKDRKAVLERALMTGSKVRLVTHVLEQGEALAESARSLGFEGVVGKRADSRYEPGARSRAWVKVKTVQQQEFVVGGYTKGEGGRSKSFGALAIGYYDDGKLRYAGNVGSGFNDAMLTKLTKALRELEREKSPFDAGKVEGNPKFVEPRLIAEVKYSEWTKDGRLRAPVFLGLRDDIEPSQVHREKPASIEALPEVDEGSSITTSVSSSNGATSSTPTSAVEAVLRQLEEPKANFVVDVAGEAIKLSNLDKIFWPAYEDRPPLTKRDLIRYYTEMAPILLPHLKERPLTLTRYPNGIIGALFYQKHYGQPIPEFVDTVPIWSSENDSAGIYIMCNNLPTLVWLAQIADLELHAWMSRVDPSGDAEGRPLVFGDSEGALDESVLNYPDYMIFDLDPYIYSGREGKGAEPEFNRHGYEKTVEVALALKELLDQMRLSSYVKTTGKTGIHVYVPILRHYDYDTVRAVTQTIGQFLLRADPKGITMDWDTSKRTGKVFFDHNQNTRGKTLAAQYSLRPTPWAGVSMPVAWSELPAVDPTSFTLTSVPPQIAARGDLWADILDRKNDLSAILAAVGA
jgi:bifunctional non-homologous end joining protein LigD